MSAETKPPENSTDETDQSWAEAHREELEREANSDGSHAWVCEAILQSLEGDS
ncbi:hypothetical protein [Haloarcula amylovorans]|uniref:hypothetical protein n=1 Tax=Haloarcula amylovorans TaxID=2562280 RepID=UPI001430D5ED|nr:hypothetical protein [Halomicroarcula amylolytica]